MARYSLPIMKLQIPIFTICALLVAVLFTSACSSSITARRGKARPCPTVDLTVPCGRTASGGLFRL
ncbi:MAG: hypothetical protein IIC64_19820 [SAR324 cluster bacterium]|nr:hypothetical protein [SAR324 cluster bacterium]